MGQTIEFESIRGLVAALALAAAGGWIGALLGLPAGWLTGGMVAVSIAAVAGLKVSMPGRLIDAAMITIGIMLGTGVTPEVVAGLGKWPVSLAMLAASVVACQVAMQEFLVRFGGWDRATAYFAALPGAMLYALAGAAEVKADLRRVAINQLTRLFLLILVLPTAVIVVEAGNLPPVRVAASPLGLFLLLGVAVPAALLFQYLRVPVGLMTGAFLASALLQGSGTVEGSFPAPVLIAAFVVLGGSIGVRFAGTTLRFIAANALPTFGAFLVGVVVSFLAALAVTWMVEVPLDQLIVAFAPGGVDAMIAVALALHMDTAFVAAHQIFRLMGVILLGPVGARLALGRRVGGKRDTGR